MNSEIIVRSLIALFISAAGIVVYLVTNRMILRRAISRVRMFKDYQVGRAAIVYFTTPTCAPCKTIQRPAIQALKAQLGEDLQIFEVDASKQPEIAQQWGVLSVPTTFIVDTTGIPRHINHGIATFEKLNSQLEDYVI